MSCPNLTNQVGERERREACAWGGGVAATLLAHVSRHPNGCQASPYGKTRGGGGRGWQKECCASKGTIIKVKRQPTKWEKTFANHISDKGLVSVEYITEHMFLPKGVWDTGMAIDPAPIKAQME